MRSQCMKLVRQRNQAGGMKFGHLAIYIDDKNIIEADRDLHEDTLSHKEFCTVDN